MQNENVFLIAYLKNWGLCLQLLIKLHTYCVNIVMKIEGGGGGHTDVRVNVLN
jgi:hypothetical protein